MRYLLSIIAILCLLPGTSEAQLLSFRSYSIENGLSESVVNDLMQDRNGYIWIATEYGLNRFDGISFKNFYTENGLSDNKTYSLYQDQSRRIWVGTGNGVNLVEGDSLTTIPVLKPLSTVPVLEIFQDSDGEFWFATDGKGIWYWDGEEELIQYTELHGLVNNRVRDVIEDESGALWIGTRGGLTRLKDGNFRSYTHEDGLPEDLIRDLEFDEGNSFWIGTRDGLSYHRNGSFFNFWEEDGLVNNRIQSLSRDHRGNLWIGTEEGVSFFGNGEFINYSVEQGLPNNIVYATLYDRENNIWFGTLGGGISVFLGNKFKNYTIEEGLPNNVITSITQDQKGNHWISTYGGGIAKFDGENFTVFNQNNGLVDNKVYTITVDSKNRLFIGTRWGLSIYDGEGFYNLDESELPYRKIRSIEETEPDREYWLATYGEGVIRYRDGEFRQLTEEDGLANNTVMSVEKHDGATWFGTYGGISKYEDGEFTNYTVREGLPNNGVMDLFVDHHGVLWASTFGGIARVDNGGITSFTTSEGLPDKVCYFIVQDADGIFWIGSNKGIIRFDYGQYRLMPESKDHSAAFKLITQDQGLIANEMNAGAGYMDQDRILWFGSVGGVSRFNPDMLQPNRTPPKLHIEEIMVGGESISSREELKIPSGSQNITFEYIGINLTAPEQVVYEYRLRGSGEDWQQTRQRSVRYSALLPGDYTFEVRAQNNDGVWSSERSTVSFTVMAPFYYQWWFFGVVILVIAAVILFIYHYYRVRKMVDMERMRVRIASDLHDDVGSSLTEIALQSDFLQTTELDPKFKESLKQIGTQSRKIVSSLDDIVWSIDARNDTLGDLTDRMQDYINNVLSDKEVVYHFDDLEMDDNLTVPLKENLYLIFKEAVNNIAKHSDGSRVEIKLTNSNGSYDMVIFDNGSGVPPDTDKNGYGLRNMKMRAERINADIEFTNGTGFTVHVSGKGM